MRGNGGGCQLYLLEGWGEVGWKNCVFIANGGQDTGDKVGVSPHGIGITPKEASVQRCKLDRDEGGKEKKIKNTNTSDHRWPGDPFYTFYFLFVKLDFYYLV